MPSCSTIIFTILGVNTLVLVLKPNSRSFSTNLGERGIPMEGFRLEGPPRPVLYLDFELSDKQFEKRYSEAEREGFEPNAPICSISVIYKNSFL